MPWASGSSVQFCGVSMSPSHQRVDVDGGARELPASWSTDQRRIGVMNMMALYTVAVSIIQTSGSGLR
jgi:hypothetical protein